MWIQRHAVIVGIVIVFLFLDGCTSSALPTPASATPTPEVMPLATAPSILPTATATMPLVTDTPQPTMTSTVLPPVRATVYIVQSGETLFRIALKFSVTVDALARANNISNTARVYVGQKLSIPAPVTPTSTRPATARSATPLAHSTLAPPDKVNGVPVDEFLLMPDDVKQNLRTIFVQGQWLGHNPRAFSKIGDSTIENPLFLTRFDGGPYKLGDYAGLQTVIDYFAGSFGRDSLAVHKGFHSWTMLNPAWADKTQCQPNESPVGCEFRLHKPSFAFVKLGSNDTGAPKLFQESLQKLVEFCVQNGVIPILSTKADRSEGPGDVNNTIIRKVAAENHIPLWDFDRVAQTLPGRGLDQDGVHLTAFYPHDYTLPEAFRRGHSVDNLTALIVLDRVWREATQSN
jgi:LysM repeat protein